MPVEGLDGYPEAVTATSKSFDSTFSIGEWQIHPDRNEVGNAHGRQKIEPMSMRLLVLLAENAPHTTTRDQMVERLWSGRAVTDDAINKQISKLRGVFEDTAKSPRLIETIPKIGARLMVVPIVDAPSLNASGTVKSTHHRQPLWKPAGVAAIALLVLALVFTFSNRRDGEGGYKLLQAPATAMPGSEIDPALSPDGVWLAYSSRLNASEHFGLFIRKTGMETVRRLTSADVDGRAPAWSADGRLAFVLRENGTCQIMVGFPDTGFRAVASCLGADIGGVAWADANRIVVSDRPGLGHSFRLELLDLRNGRRKTLTHPPKGDSGDLSPVVNAAKGLVYFLRVKSVGPQEVFEVSLASGTVRALTNEGAKINGLGRGPDGKLLLSSQREGRGYALWTLDPITGRWEFIAPGPAPDLTSSADGRTIIFLRSDTRITLWQAPLKGGEGSPVAPSTGIDWSPTLAPNGRHLAFISNRSGAEEVWLVELGGGNPSRLSNFSGPDVQDLAWSPDGLSLAVSLSSKGQFDLYLINAQGRSVNRLIDTPQDERQPFFSPDGNNLWFVRRQGERYDLIDRDLASGRERVAAMGVIRAVPAERGAQIYFAKPFQPGLYRLEENRSAVKVAPWPDIAGVRNFSTSNDALWGLARNASGDSLLMRMDVRSNQSSPVRTLPGVARRSGLAVVGDSVIYAKLLRQESDLVQLRIERQ